MSSAINLAKKLKKNNLLVTPRLELWLMRNSHLLVSEINAEILKTVVTTKPRDRSNAFSSSTRGSCHRAQMFQYLGVPSAGEIDPGLHAIFIDGTWRHLRWQMLLLEAGILTDIEVPFYNEEYRLKGSLDGTNEEEGWGFELKGTSNSSVVSGAAPPFPYHELQIHTYFVGRPDLQKFVLLYEDKRYQSWREVIVERDPKIMRAVHDELEYLNACVDDRVLPPVLTECKAGQGQTFRKCSFRDICRECDYESAEATAQAVRVRVASKTEASGKAADDQAHDGRGIRRSRIAKPRSKTL